MHDAITAALLLLGGCMLLAAVEMIGQRVERRRRIRSRRELRRMMRSDAK